MARQNIQDIFDKPSKPTKRLRAIVSWSMKQASQEEVHSFFKSRCDDVFQALQESCTYARERQKTISLEDVHDILRVLKRLVRHNARAVAQGWRLPGILLLVSAALLDDDLCHSAQFIAFEALCCVLDALAGTRNAAMAVLTGVALACSEPLEHVAAQEKEDGPETVEVAARFGGALFARTARLAALTWADSARRSSRHELACTGVGVHDVSAPATTPATVGTPEDGCFSEAATPGVVSSGTCGAASPWSFVSLAPRARRTCPDGRFEALLTFACALRITGGSAGRLGVWLDMLRGTWLAHLFPRVLEVLGPDHIFFAPPSHAAGMLEARQQERDAPPEVVSHLLVWYIGLISGGQVSAILVERRDLILLLEVVRQAMRLSIDFHDALLSALHLYQNWFRSVDDCAGTRLITEHWGSIVRGAIRDLEALVFTVSNSTNSVTLAEASLVAQNRRHMLCREALQLYLSISSQASGRALRPAEWRLLVSSMLRAFTMLTQEAGNSVLTMKEAASSSDVMAPAPAEPDAIGPMLDCLVRVLVHAELSLLCGSPTSVPDAQQRDDLEEVEEDEEGCLPSDCRMGVDDIAAVVGAFVQSPVPVAGQGGDGSTGRHLIASSLIGHLKDMLLRLSDLLFGLILRRGAEQIEPSPGCYRCSADVRADAERGAAAAAEMGLMYTLPRPLQTPWDRGEAAQDALRDGILHAFMTLWKLLPDYDTQPPVLPSLLARSMDAVSCVFSGWAQWMDCNDAESARLRLPSGEDILKIFGRRVFTACIAHGQDHRQSRVAAARTLCMISCRDVGWSSRRSARFVALLQRALCNDSNMNDVAWTVLQHGAPTFKVHFPVSVALCGPWLSATSRALEFGSGAPVEVCHGAVDGLVSFAGFGPALHRVAVVAASSQAVHTQLIRVALGYVAPAELDPTVSVELQQRALWALCVVLTVHVMPHPCVDAVKQTAEAKITVSQEVLFCALKSAGPHATSAVVPLEVPVTALQVLEVMAAIVTRASAEIVWSLSADVLEQLGLHLSAYLTEHRWPLSAREEQWLHVVRAGSAFCRDGATPVMRGELLAVLTMRCLQRWLLALSGHGHVGCEVLSPGAGLWQAIDAALLYGLDCECGGADSQEVTDTEEVLPPARTKLNLNFRKWRQPWITSPRRGLCQRAPEQVLHQEDVVTTPVKLGHSVSAPRLSASTAYSAFASPFVSVHAAAAVTLGIPLRPDAVAESASSTPDGKLGTAAVPTIGGCDGAPFVRRTARALLERVAVSAHRCDEDDCMTSDKVGAEVHVSMGDRLLSFLAPDNGAAILPPNVAARATFVARSGAGMHKWDLELLRPESYVPGVVARASATPASDCAYGGGAACGWNDGRGSAGGGALGPDALSFFGGCGALEPSCEAWQGGGLPFFDHLRCGRLMPLGPKSMSAGCLNSSGRRTSLRARPRCQRLRRSRSEPIVLGECATATEPPLTRALRLEHWCYRNRGCLRQELEETDSLGTVIWKARRALGEGEADTDLELPVECEADDQRRAAVDDQVAKLQEAREGLVIGSPHCHGAAGSDVGPGDGGFFDEEGVVGQLPWLFLSHIGRLGGLGASSSGCRRGPVRASSGDDECALPWCLGAPLLEATADERSAHASRLRRSLRLLDQQNPCRERVKCGVVFVGRGQNTEAEVLANSCGSLSFERLVDALGWPVRLVEHRGFLGGLDPGGSAGHIGTYYEDAEVEAMFHVATRMPSSPNDVQQLSKKKHVGNDAVVVVWTEQDLCRSLPISLPYAQTVLLLRPLYSAKIRSVGSDFDSDATAATCTSDGCGNGFVATGDAREEAEEEEQESPDLVLVDVHTKLRSLFGPLQDGAIVPISALAPLVRLTVICAHGAAAAAAADTLQRDKRLPDECPHEMRLRGLREIATRYGPCSTDHGGPVGGERSTVGACTTNMEAVVDAGKRHQEALVRALCLPLAGFDG